MQNRNYAIVVAVMAATSMLMSSSARAGLIITIPDVIVAPGGSGFLDVLVSSDGMDSFQSYSLDFIVRGPGQAAAPINFVESDFVPFDIPAPQLIATDLDHNYIFLGDSLEAVSPIGIDFVSDSLGLPAANDLINVMDSTDSFSNRTIEFENGYFLLARLNFEAPLNATLGNVYEVSLDDDIDLIQGFYDDFYSPVAFTSIPGSITIDTAAVPEPSSIVLMAIGLLMWFARRCWSWALELSTRTLNSASSYVRNPL